METEKYYNWDDLEVGRFDLNHSERFFTKKHDKHEKIDTDFDNVMEGKGMSNEFKIPAIVGVGTNENKDPTSSTEKVSKDPTSIPSNILRQPLVSKNRMQPNEASNNAVPSVLKYQNIYEKKRQNKIQKLLEEEKKKRIFKSKPAPSFSSNPTTRKPVELKPITTPVTPLVLKHSKETEEKRKRQIEEYKKRNEPQKFVSRNPQVLYEEPFKPQKVEHHVDPQPFNLHMEKRLDERRQYDKQIKLKTEEKKRQEEYERKKNEERFVRELRKMTTFKARPNPFK